ncbi:unnamed protein product [Urochloa decumbens]|uniref:SKP1-like protein n=1 Tax=Urochloa decumbens TaxID=240449 RepID=A0ABC9EBQ3_9POAL
MPPPARATRRRTRNKRMGSAASRDVRTITLISSDDERFEVPEAAASLSQVIRNAIVDNDGDGIQLPRIAGKVLAMVIEYCSKHAAAAAAVSSSGEAPNNSNEELRSFDEKFIDVDQFTLYDVLVAAYYLQIQELLDLACQEVYDRLEEKTRAESRKTLRLKDDYFVPALDDEEQWLFV